MEANWEVDITASDTVLQDLSSFDFIVCYIALLSAQAMGVTNHWTEVDWTGLDSQKRQK